MKIHLILKIEEWHEEWHEDHEDNFSVVHGFKDLSSAEQKLLELNKRSEYLEHLSETISSLIDKYLNLSPFVRKSLIRDKAESAKAYASPDPSDVRDGLTKYLKQELQIIDPIFYDEHIKNDSSIYNIGQGIPVYKLKTIDLE